MSRALFVVFVTAMALPTTAAGQRALPLEPAEARLEDYGIEGAGAVVRGRVSLAFTPDGPRLGIYFLRDTPPRTAGGGETAPPPPAPRDDVGEPRETLSALWVWNTRELLRDDEERRVFLDFVEERRIARVFLYLPAAEGSRAEAGFVPFDGARVGPLVAGLRARGALTYGLDGDPAYALPENHAGVWRTVERVVEHNRSVPPEQRLHGVRYDVEPYLVPGFHGPRREALLDGYVALVAGMARVAKGADLAVGVDIPFWLDEPDEETGVVLEATLDGVRLSVLEHLVTLVDDVAIMDYRTQARGPDGAVAHALGELEAARTREVGVFVGVETTRLVDEDLYTFSGSGAQGPPADPGRWIVLQDRGEGRVAIWMVDAGSLPPALAEADAGTLRHWPAGRAAHVAGDRQSFHALGPDLLLAETERISRLLGAHPAFRGLAYHDYRGLQRLLSGEHGR